MILRKPNFQDIYKATQVLSDDEEEQKQILQEWLYLNKNNPSFFSYVIVKDHEVLAVVTGWADNKAVTIHKITGADKLKQTLFNKVLKEFDPEYILFMTNEIDTFVSENNFKIQRYSLGWTKPKEENDIEVTDEISGN